jgi:hypothetical protein
VRMDASWQMIQPTPPQEGTASYDFSHTDDFVAALAAANLTWLPILDYSASWNASIPGDKFSPPARPAAFAAFARAVAERYGAHGSFWHANSGIPRHPVRLFEIWNEENSRFYWQPSPAPGAYAKLYLHARAAIRTADPTAEVIAGGITEPTASSFVRRMFRATPALTGNVDAFGLHPYKANADQVVASVAAFRRTLVALHETSAPIALTEFGWPAGRTPRAERWRARQMAIVAAALGDSQCGVQLLAPFDWINIAAVPAQNWGLASVSGLTLAGRTWFAKLAEARTQPLATPCAGALHHTVVRRRHDPLRDPSASRSQHAPRQVATCDVPATQSHPPLALQPRSFGRDARRASPRTFAASEATHRRIASLPPLVVAGTVTCRPASVPLGDSRVQTRKPTTAA